MKTRKRNIVIPSDPGSFADAVIAIFQDASEGVSVEKDLEAAAKVLDSTDNIDFSRYADTLFEVLFAGGRLATGGNLADDAGPKLGTNVSPRGRGAARRPRRPRGAPARPPCRCITAPASSATAGASAQPTRAGARGGRRASPACGQAGAGCQGGPGARGAALAVAIRPPPPPPAADPPASPCLPCRS